MKSKVRGVPSQTVVIDKIFKNAVFRLTVVGKDGYVTCSK